MLKIEDFREWILHSLSAWNCRIILEFSRSLGRRCSSGGLRNGAPSSFGTIRGRPWILDHSYFAFRRNINPLTAIPKTTQTITLIHCGKYKSSEPNINFVLTALFWLHKIPTNQKCWFPRVSWNVILCKQRSQLKHCVTNSFHFFIRKKHRLDKWILTLTSLPRKPLKQLLIELRIIWNVAAHHLSSGRHLQLAVE